MWEKGHGAEILTAHDNAGAHGANVLGVAGEHFGLLITEEPGDLARLKADLDRDMLRKHTVIEETAEKLVYRSEFPDDAGTYIHFYRSVQVGDRTFVVTDADQVRFNEADVKRMAASIKTKEAA